MVLFSICAAFASDNTLESYNLRRLSAQETCVDDNFALKANEVHIFTLSKHMYPYGRPYIVPRRRVGP